MDFQINSVIVNTQLTNSGELLLNGPLVEGKLELKGPVKTAALKSSVVGKDKPITITLQEKSGKNIILKLVY